MSRLNKLQIYAIQWLNSQNKKPEDIAQDLDLKIDTVLKTLEKYNTNNISNSIKTTNEPVIDKKKNRNLLINETSGKKNKSVSIMTKEASEYHDSVRNKVSTNPKTDKFIFRSKK